MTDVLVGLPLVALVALVVGGGWSCLLEGLFSASVVAGVVRAWLAAIALYSVVAAWAYPANLTARETDVVVAALTVVGYGVRLRRRGRLLFRRPALEVRHLAALVLAVVTVLVAIAPAIASPSRLTVAERIGPDAVGYAIASSAIASGATRSEIEHAIVEQTGARSAQDAVSPKTRLVDTAPSFTVQVENEFLTGANRWTLPEMAGSILALVGRSHLWSLLSLLAGFFLLVGVLAAYQVVRDASGSDFAALAAIVLVGLNTSLLNDWHEGGLGEMVVVPAAVLVGLAVVSFEQSSLARSCVALGTAVAIVVPSYNEGLLAYGGVVVVSILLSPLVFAQSWWRSSLLLVASVLVAFCAVAPESLLFAETLTRSVSENGGAGWAQPRWSSPAEAFGLGNPYDLNEVLVLARSRLDAVLDGLANGALVGMLLALGRRLLRSASTVLLLSVLLVGGGIYVKTRYLDGATSYQYFKAIMLLVPVGAVGFATLLGRELAERRGRSRYPILAACVAMALGVGASGIAYVTTFRSEGAVLPPELAALGASQAAVQTFAKYNVVAFAGLSFGGSPVGGIQFESIGAEIDLNWIGRNIGGPATHIGTSKDKPVALVIQESECANWSCIGGAERHIILKTDGIVLVDLDMSTADLARYPESSWGTIATTRFEHMGGRITA